MTDRTPDTPAPPPSGGTAPDSRTADEDVRNEMREWSAAGAAAFLAFEASLPENDEPAPPTAEPELDEKRMIEQLDALATLAETAGRGGEVARTLRAAHKALTDPNYRHALHEHVRALEARLAAAEQDSDQLRLSVAQALNRSAFWEARAQRRGAARDAAEMAAAEARAECDAAREALGELQDRLRGATLYETVAPDAPCQIVGVHPTRWGRDSDPKFFLREFDVDALSSGDAPETRGGTDG